MKKYIKCSTNGSTDKVIDWLAEHDQAFEDFKEHFDVDDESAYSVAGSLVLEWIAEHDQLWLDLLDHFHVDPEWADEAYSEQVFRLINEGKPKYKKSDVYRYLKEDTVSDYNQNIEDLMDEFLMTRSEAESYVWNFRSGLHKMNSKSY